MAEGKCATCARYVLVIFNLVFWIIGIVLMGGGIWLLVSSNADDQVKEWIHLTVNEDALDGIGYGILGVGCFMFFIGFCGCCGAIRESALMLAVYIFFMALLLLGELAALIYFFVERSSLEAMARNQLLRDVKNYNNTGKESPIDFIQLRFKCCGSEGYTDYYNYSTFFQDEFNQGKVPESCCRVKPDSNPPVPANYSECLKEVRNDTPNPSQLYTTGCFYMLSDLIDNNSAAFIGFAVGMVVVAIIGIVFAVFLCRNRTEYDFYDE